MKLRSYLVRTAYGFAFRLRVPRDLATYLPQQSVKHALPGYNQRQAQLAALLLAGRYARAFDNLRQGTRAMAKKGKDTSHLIDLGELVEQAGEALTEARAEERVSKLLNRPKEAKATHGQKDLKLGMGANGPFLETEPGDSPQVIQAAMQTLQSMMASKPVQAAPSPSSVKAIDATKAADAHIDHITPTTKPKTLTIKAAAVNGFVAHYIARTGNKKAKLSDATSGDVGAWVSMLHKTLAPNYVHNKAVYVQHFFKWGMANNYYPQGQNPAVGHTAFTKRQQQARLKHGFRAFASNELQDLFDTSNFETVGPATRWGIVLALYTGARASEIGQLRIADFGIYQKGMLRENPLLPLDPQPKGKDWVYAINITDEGPGQSLKGADSRRTIFIHNDLITLGLLDRVRVLRDKGETQFFPGVKLSNKNGAGNWLSKQFSNYRAKIVPDDPTSPRKIGLHSFRKSATQTLQQTGGGDALRHYFLGHDPGTVQSTTYADLAPIMQERFFGSAHFGASMAKLHPVMNEQKKRLQKKTRKVKMTQAQEAEKAQTGRV